MIGQQVSLPHMQDKHSETSLMAPNSFTFSTTSVLVTQAKFMHQKATLAHYTTSTTFQMSLLLITLITHSIHHFQLFSKQINGQLFPRSTVMNFSSHHHTTTSSEATHIHSHIQTVSDSRKGLLTWTSST